MQTSAKQTVVSLALGGMAIIGLAVPGSLTGGLPLACWAALICGLAVRSLFVLSPVQGGRRGGKHGQLVPALVVRVPSVGRGNRSCR